MPIPNLQLATLALAIGNNSTMATIPHWQHYAMRQNSALATCAWIVYTTAILRGACAAREHSPENATVGSRVPRDRSEAPGRLINVASTLHVVHSKYSYFSRHERHVSDDASSWAHCFFVYSCRPVGGHRVSAWKGSALFFMHGCGVRGGLRQNL